MALTNAEKQAVWRERRQERINDLVALVERQSKVIREQKKRISELEEENEWLRKQFSASPLETSTSPSDF
jgi:hypothetical protein